MNTPILLQGNPVDDSTAGHQQGPRSTRTEPEPPTQPPSSPLPNELFPTLDGRYRQVGAPRWGGMGIVFQAHDTILNTPVAIKRIRPELIQDQQLRDRFAQEARAQFTLYRVPGIVAAHHYAVDRVGPYLILDWIEGQSLQEIMDALPENEVLPWEMAALLCASACDALHPAHEKGFIHRDIKPSNLRRGTNGTLWVGDFGVVLLMPREMSGNHFTHSAATLGSPHYMSPEQDKDPRNATPQSDIWSLGATLHYLVTRRRMCDLRDKKIPKK